MSTDQQEVPAWLGKLDRKVLMAATAEQTGLDDFGDERFIEQLSFEARGDGLFYRMPEYTAWLRSRSAAYCYQYLRDLLRYLQWQDGGRRGRPWVLKSPPHLGHIDQIFETFPGATIVHCHRDPATVVASFCSLIDQIRVSRGIEVVDREQLGAYRLHFCVEDWSRNLELRAACPADQIFDVTYDEIVSDTPGIINRIYASRGMTIREEALSSMAAWEQENPQGRFGLHDYTLESYGLTRQQVNHAFGDYLARFPEVARQRA
jgi:hypothetical protein